MFNPGLNENWWASTLQQTPRVAVATCPAAPYRARNPRATPLYRLFDAHFEEVKGQWEDRFERRYGFWRGFVDEQIRRYLDCGLYENGFARVRCPDCHEEYLLAFSCKTRELCPSCAAKRSAEIIGAGHGVTELLKRELLHSSIAVDLGDERPAV